MPGLREACVGARVRCGEVIAAQRFSVRQSAPAGESEYWASMLPESNTPVGFLAACLLTRCNTLHLRRRARENLHCPLSDPELINGYGPYHPDDRRAAGRRAGLGRSLATQRLHVAAGPGRADRRLARALRSRQPLSGHGRGRGRPLAGRPAVGRAPHGGRASRRRVALQRLALRRDAALGCRGDR